MNIKRLISFLIRYHRLLSLSKIFLIEFLNIFFRISGRRWSKCIMFLSFIILCFTIKFNEIMKTTIKLLCDVAAGCIFGGIAYGIMSAVTDSFALFWIMLASSLGAILMDILWEKLIDKKIKDF